MIDGIREMIAADVFEYSKHAVDQSILRNITVVEVREAIAFGEVIEVYPHDKYGPSGLISGQTSGGRAIHVQSSYPTRTPMKIITLYEPDTDLWIDFKTRRPKNEG